MALADPASMPAVIAEEAVRFVFATSAKQERDAVESIADKLNKRQTKIKIFVEALSQYLNSEKLEQQDRAVNLLASVLAKLDADKTLRTPDISLLASYFIGRLSIQSSPGARHAILGLQSLSEMKYFDPESVIDIVKVLLSDKPDFATQPVLTRGHVYKLLTRIVVTFRSTLEPLESIIIDGLLDLFRKEGDPVNLMLAFPLLSYVIGDFPQDEGQVTLLWDFVCRYYPITFTPKADDPQPVTAEDLKLQLRLCMAATSKFASLAFPFLFGKLDDHTTANVKKDIMRTVTACALSYDPEVLAIWSFQIWETLKYEIISPNDDELRVAALEAIKTVAIRLSRGLNFEGMDDTPLYRYIALINSDCSRYIKEFKIENLRHSALILSAVAGASPIAFHLLVKHIIPVVKKLYTENGEISKKALLLEVLNALLKTRYDFELRVDTSTVTSANFEAIDGVILVDGEPSTEYGGLYQMRGDLLQWYESALTNTTSLENEFRMKALEGLILMASTKRLFSQEEVGSIVEIIVPLLTQQEDGILDTKLRSAAIVGLRKLCAIWDTGVETTIFSKLFDALPTSAYRKLPPANGSATQLRYLGILEAAGMIAAGNNSCQALLSRLLTSFSVCLVNDNSTDQAQLVLIGVLFALNCTRDYEQPGKRSTWKLAEHGAYCVDFLHTLLTLVIGVGSEINKNTNGVDQTVKFIGLRDLMTEAQRADADIQAANRSLRNDELLVHQMHEVADHHILTLVGKISASMIRGLSPSDQEKVSPELLKLFQPVGEQYVNADWWSWQAQPEDNIIGWLFSVDEKTIVDKRNMIVASNNAVTILPLWLLLGLRREIALPFDARAVCLASLKVVANSSHQPPAHKALREYVATLVNKFGALDSPASAQKDDCTPQEFIKSLIKNVLSGSSAINVTKPLPDHTYTDKDQGSFDMVKLDSLLETIFEFVHAANLKGDRCVRELLVLLIDEALYQPLFGKYFATKFEKLIGPHDLLTAEHHAKISPLAKQKLFGMVVPQLIQSFTKSKEETPKDFSSVKANFLVALAGVLRYAPADVVLPYMDTLLPLLLQTIKLRPVDNQPITSAVSGVYEAALSCLNMAILNCPDQVVEHANSIIGCLRGIWLKGNYTSAERLFRIKALKCTSIISGSLPTAVVLPYKSEMIRDLTRGPLADSSRLVRDEAVDCLMHWRLIAEPDVEDD